MPRTRPLGGRRVVVVAPESSFSLPSDPFKLSSNNNVEKKKHHRSASDNATNNTTKTTRLMNRHRVRPQTILLIAAPLVASLLLTVVGVVTIMLVNRHYAAETGETFPSTLVAGVSTFLRREIQAHLAIPLTVHKEIAAQYRAGLMTPPVRNKTHPTEWIEQSSTELETEFALRKDVWWRHASAQGIRITQSAPPEQLSELKSVFINNARSWWFRDVTQEKHFFFDDENDEEAEGGNNSDSNNSDTDVTTADEEVVQEEEGPQPLRYFLRGLTQLGDDMRYADLLNDDWYNLHYVTPFHSEYYNPLNASDEGEEGPGWYYFEGAQSHFALTAFLNAEVAAAEAMEAIGTLDTDTGVDDDSTMATIAAQFDQSLRPYFMASITSGPTTMQKFVLTQRVSGPILDPSGAVVGATDMTMNFGAMGAALEQFSNTFKASSEFNANIRMTSFILSEGGTVLATTGSASDDILRIRQGMDDGTFVWSDDGANCLATVDMNSDDEPVITERCEMVPASYTKEPLVRASAPLIPSLCGDGSPLLGVGQRVRLSAVDDAGSNEPVAEWYAIVCEALDFDQYTYQARGSNFASWRIVTIVAEEEIVGPLSKIMPGTNMAAGIGIGVAGLAAVVAGIVAFLLVRGTFGAN